DHFLPDGSEAPKPKSNVYYIPTAKANQQANEQKQNEKEHKVVIPELLQLDTSKDLVPAKENTLRGEKIKVTVQAHKKGTTKGVLYEIDSKTVYLYRFIDVTDNEHKDGKMEFEKTFANGTVVQQKAIAMEMPMDAQPQFKLKSEILGKPANFQW